MRLPHFRFSQLDEAGYDMNNYVDRGGVIWHLSASLFDFLREPSE